MSVEGPTPGTVNMLKDSEMLVRAIRSETSARVYGWEGAWVSLGRFQDSRTAVVEGFTQVVVRPTGGRAVLHGHDVTVSYAQPFQGRSVKTAYLSALEPIVAALNACGLPCGVAHCCAVGVASEDCFQASSIYDLVHSGSGDKVGGAAMRLVRGALLLQVSVPYTRPLVQPERAIRGGVAVPVHCWTRDQFPCELERVLNGRWRSSAFA